MSAERLVTELYIHHSTWGLSLRSISPKTVPSVDRSSPPPLPPSLLHQSSFKTLLLHTITLHLLRLAFERF